jgi:hypothetical protein
MQEETQIMPQESTSASDPTVTMSLKDEIAKAISERSSKEVRGRVVNSLADEEIAARASAILAALKKRDEADRELKKLKGQQKKGYNNDGAEVLLPFEKAEFEAINKKTQEIKKIDAAIAVAFSEKPDYSKVKQLGNG